VDKDQCNDLLAYVSTVSATLARAPVEARQACYLPIHRRSGREQLPLIGRTSTQGLWLATGHTCWGIQNAPATGFLMAEMLLEGKAKSADLAAFDPSRYL
jgi:glycine/D-amino acid oxidase-like deaminating enzyme